MFTNAFSPEPWTVEGTRARGNQPGQNVNQPDSHDHNQNNPDNAAEGIGKRDKGENPEDQAQHDGTDKNLDQESREHGKHLKAFVARGWPMLENSTTLRECNGGHNDADTPEQGSPVRDSGNERVPGKVRER